MQKMMDVPTRSLDGISFDGADFWISDVVERTLKKVSIHEQKVLREIKFMPGGVPRAVTYTNDSLLVLNYDPKAMTASDLIQINVMNGKTLRALHCPDEIDSGIAFDNTYFWGSSYQNRCLLCFHPATGDIVKTVPMEYPVQALCFDGQHLIVVMDKRTDPQTPLSQIAVFHPAKLQILKEMEIKAEITGITYAEDMLFYVNHQLSEIQVTRIKLD
ncbi:MAG: hypothetical protein H3C47_06390 [Candidatus Cloacimonetes bacterium]|nr:hypothetical protein [Candidatus Cloacimonadota bacterium]